MTHPSVSIHDNSLYGYEFDARTSTLVLRTVYSHRSPEEFTDVWFNEVWTHHLESVLGHDIIFEVVESEITAESNLFGDLFRRLQREGWPRIDKREDSIADTIARKSLRVWHVASSYGVSGFVIAKEMSLVNSVQYRQLKPPAR